MQKVLIVDPRYRIGEFLNVQLMVSEYEDYFSINAIVPEKKGEVKEFLKGKNFDFVLIEHDMLDRRCTKQEFGSIPVYGYAMEAKSVASFDKNGIPYMGIAPDAEEMVPMLDAIAKGEVPVVKQPAPVAQTVEVEDDDEEEIVASAEEVLKGLSAPAKPVTPTPAPPAPPEPVQPEPSKQKEEDPPREERRRVEDTVKPFEFQTYQEYQMPERQIAPQEHKTRVLSVYSAKGGVGKSTLSANLALYLSMMDHGRGKYRVCLVDYNIESGDIRTLLGFKGEKLVDMGIWAEDIHQMLKRGMSPGAISFSREQIYRYLTPYHDKTGLYVLLAPMLHENAQFIEANEIQIMLQNIIRNGEFDFVICDTADNTSDSSYCALEASDEVYLVCTQDVTTATRNDSVMRSLKHTGMDMSKFRIIINNVTSKRKAGVSVTDIEKYFEGYPCVGRIHENTDVLHANNYASPLVLKPHNEFTEDLRKIVLYILNEKDEESSKKKGVLGRLFKRK